MACLREGDTAARVGGDEFAILLDDVTPTDVAPISARILAAFNAPVPIDGRGVKIQASIGVAQGDRLFVGMADLLTCADIAMYAAKDAGKGRLVAFESGMRMAAVEQVAATAELRRAVDEGQLEVRYQPIVALPSGLTQAWRHWFAGGTPSAAKSCLPSSFRWPRKPG